jgi:hypothetical protein
MMMKPEDALARARAAADEQRAAGAYGDDLHGFEVEAEEEPSKGRLARWALIAPDPDDVYSTRRLGAPITLLKRGLLRLLAQYHRQLLAQQSRFNAQVVRKLEGLDERVAQLEERGAAKEPPRKGDSSDRA